MPVPNFVILYVDSPARSADFYAKLFDRPPVENSPTFAMFVLDDGHRLGPWSRHTVSPAASAPGGAAELVFAEDRMPRSTPATWNGRRPARRSSRRARRRVRPHLHRRRSRRPPPALSITSRRTRADGEVLARRRLADHVRIGRAGGFMQVNHGKAAPLRRVRPGATASSITRPPPSTARRTDFAPSPRSAMFARASPMSASCPAIFGRSAVTSTGLRCARDADRAAARPPATDRRKVELGLCAALRSGRDPGSGFRRHRGGDGCRAPRAVASLTAIPAARSSSAAPTDLNSVISSAVPRPGFSRASARTGRRRCRRRRARPTPAAGRCRRPPRGAGAGVDIDPARAADRLVVGLAHRRREAADEVDMGSGLQFRAADQRIGGDGGRGNDVGPAERLAKIARRRRGKPVVTERIRRLLGVCRGAVPDAGSRGSGAPPNAPWRGTGRARPRR